MGGTKWNKGGTSEGTYGRWIGTIFPFRNCHQWAPGGLKMASKCHKCCFLKSFGVWRIALRCILRRPDLHQPVCLMIFPSLSDCVKSGVHTRRGSVRKCCIIRKRGGRATKEMSHYPKWPAASFRPLWLCSCPTSREARQKEGKGEIWWKIFMDAWFTSTSTQGFGAWEIA